jgi:nitrate/TMAO reductase-like tetraheme cytochrome c subunit
MKLVFKDVSWEKLGIYFVLPTCHVPYHLWPIARRKLSKLVGVYNQIVEIISHHIAMTLFVGVLQFLIVINVITIKFSQYHGTHKEP